ncbi:MAG: hypothetical protein AAFX99_34645, partial [Myxococcota bacterium]
ETFETWLTELGITAETALAVTCGDWDLESMWPRQAALVPELKTPALFKRWCNLKVIFKEATGYRKGVGMMGMLRQLRLTHQGHHHRGEDDVTNLSAVVVSLLERGAQFRPTWGEPERRREHKRLSRKLNQLNQQLKERRAALDNLPDHVAEEVAHHIHVQIDTITAEQNRLEAYLRARH